MKLHFFADFACSVHIEGVPAFLPPKTLLNAPGEILVTCRPFCQNSYTQNLPYTFCLNTKTLKCSCPFIHILMYDNENCEIHLLPNLFYKTLKSPFTHSFNHSGQTLTAEVYPSGLFCLTGLPDTQLSFLPLTASFQLIPPLLLVSGATENSNYCIAADLSSQSILLCDVFLKIEIDTAAKTLKTMQKGKGFLRHAIVQNFALSPFINKDMYPVYLKEKPPALPHVSLLPFAFFEAVQCQNYTYAKSLMCDSLKKRLTNRHLKEFFKEYTYLTQNPYSTDEALLLFNPQNMRGKKVLFTINQQGKIENVCPE